MLTTFRDPTGIKHLCDKRYSPGNPEHKFNCYN